MKNKRLFLGLTVLAVLTISSCSLFPNNGAQSSKKVEESQNINTSNGEYNTSELINPTSQPASSENKSSSFNSSSNSTGRSSNSNNSQSSNGGRSSSSSSSSSQPSSSNGGNTSSVNPNSNFSNITEFNSPVEIHTARQKEFLAYQGKYDEIDPSLYPDGSQLISDSNPVALSWNYTAPNGKTVSSYDVTYGQKNDLSDGYTINVTSKSANLVNPYLGVNYFKIEAVLSDGSRDGSGIRSFSVDETCPRNLAIGGMTNCRDMGGRVTEDGGKIKQGLVYRTSGYKFDYSTTITEDGKKEMLQHLKVKTEVNVADSQSYNLNLTGTTVVNLNMDYGGSASHHFSRNTESVKNFFNLLGDSSNYPVYFHCRIGTDRTGLCANLLYGLLGVPVNEIYQDYLFSNFGKIGEKRYIGAKAGQDNIQNYMNEINNLSGETFKNKVYNALLAIGVSSTTLDTIISNMTEGTLAKNNNAGQVVATADKLTGNGVTVTADTSERNHPDYYFTLNSTSKSVSYTFTTPKAYKGQIVAYLGNTEHSTSKKIGDAISCKVDNNAVTIKDQTYADACMGNCSNRMNYYPVILGEADLSAGSHTITITGTSNTMNIGTLCIFDAATASSSEQQQGSGTHTTHSYIAQSPVTNKEGKTVTTYLCDCGAKYIAISFLNGYSSLSGNLSDGTQGKLTNGTVVKYDIPAKAGSNVALQFAVKMSSSSHSSQTINTSNYGIKINGSAVAIAITNGATYSNIGLSTSFAYITFAKFDIDSDMNVEVELDHNNSSYRLLFGEEVRLVYSA